MPKRDLKKEMLDTFKIEKPLKDHLINFPPHYKEQIIKGKAVSIPKIFKQSMITNKVIEG